MRNDESTGTTMEQELSLQHVHVGSGALGMGLVAWLGRRAGLSVILANRAGGSASHHRSLTLRETCEYDLVPDDSRAEHVRLAEFLFTDEDHDRFIEAVADTKTVLLTTALKDGIREEELLRLLAEAVAARVAAATSSTLYVVACENKIDSVGLRDELLHFLPTGIEAELARSIVFVPCVVDRICNEPGLDPTTSRVFVEVEQFSQWILEEPHNGSPTLQEALRTPDTEEFVEFVADLTAYRRRKAWLVNGPHLLIALNAWAAGYIRLDLFLQQNLEGRAILDEVLAEATGAFLATDPAFTAGELWESSTQTRQRFGTHPDSVERILSRFTERRIHDFFSDFYRKVTELTLPYMHQEQFAPFWTTQTLLMTTDLIYRSRYVRT